MTQAKARDHGGGLDAAVTRFGNARADWVDLSTGINPVPYPIPAIGDDAWTALPDMAAASALEQAAREFWNVPDTAAVLAAPGASSLIARIPALLPADQVRIDAQTYNEHAAAFCTGGWTISTAASNTRVVVHPNNPDGALWSPLDQGDTDFGLLVIDESFCDTVPEQSHIRMAQKPGVIILKSFGKFWGLAGLRLGFAIGDPGLIARLAQLLGPWPVSGPALGIGAVALTDPDWAIQTRSRLRADASRLDRCMLDAGAQVAGGTSLFRLYAVDNARRWRNTLARQHIWSRIFPYSKTWLRLGFPREERWQQVETALAAAGADSHSS